MNELVAFMDVTSEAMKQRHKLAAENAEAWLAESDYGYETRELALNEGTDTRRMKTRKLAADKYPEMDVQFTFHDLKAKGISVLEGSLNDKQEISGHKNVAQTARYNRKITIVPVVGNQ